MSLPIRAASSALFLGLFLETAVLADKGRNVPPTPPTPPTATPAATPAPGARPKITLKWSTASEVDNYGFFVLRGDDEKGPFKALNERILAGAGNSDIPRNYSYEDMDVVPGKAYFYYLESVSTQGVHEKFSPVIRKECCKGFVDPAAAGAPAAPIEGTPPPKASPTPGRAGASPART